MPIDSNRINLTLVPAIDDPPYRSAEYQRELSEVHQGLRGIDARLSVLMEFQDAVDASSFLKGGFTIAKTALTKAIPIITARFAGRAGRKVRLKVGDVEAEAHSVAEIKELLKEAENVRPRIKE